MSSSNQATSQKQSTPAAQIASMHQSMRSAMKANNLLLLRDTLRSRVLDKNTGNTILTDEERSAEIYKEILLYVCERYHTYNLQQKGFNSYEVTEVYPKENKDMLSILSVLMQYIFPLSEEQNGALLLEALEKSVEKLQENSASNNRISTELMPSILDRCSEETLFHLFMNATPKLFVNLPKKPELLNRLPSGKQQALLQTAIQENKLGLAYLLIMLPERSLFQSLESDDLKIQLLKQAMEAKNLFLVKDLLERNIDLVDSLEPGSKARLIETAIHFKKLDLVHLLLKNHPNLFLVPLHNFKLPILDAAEKNAWQIVDAIYKGSLFTPSPDSYKVFLKALNANTEETRALAIQFAKQHSQFVCAFYFSDEKGNTALHYAMKNGVEEVVKIILNEENYTSAGASIEAFVQQENSGECKKVLIEIGELVIKSIYDQRVDRLAREYRLKNKPVTAIALAAIEGKWNMVALHADLYKVEQSEWVKLYSETFVAAIQEGTPMALQAVLSLLKSKKTKFTFITTWIIKRIQDLIFDKKTNDLGINTVFCALLESVTSEGRFEIISQLAQEVEISLFDVFTRKNSSKPDDIKNNVIALIRQISYPILRVDIILSFLLNKKSHVWTKEEDKLHNGTREKLIAMLNADLKEILKMDNSTPDIKTIFERVNTLLDAHSKEPKLTMEGFFSSTLHAVMGMRILQDFLGIVLGESPVLSFAEFEKLSIKEQTAIRAEILSIHDGSIAEGPLNPVFCKNLFSFPDSAISHILQEHRPSVKNGLNCTETGNTGYSEKERESGEKPLDSDPYASAPLLDKPLNDSGTSSDDDEPTAGADALMVSDSSPQGYQEQGTSDGRTRVLVPRTPAVSHPTPSAPPAPIFSVLPQQLDHTYPNPPLMPLVPSESTPPVASSSSGLSSPVGFFPSVPTTPVAVSSSLAMLPSVPTTPPQDRRATPPDSSPRKREATCSI